MRRRMRLQSLETRCRRGRRRLLLRPQVDLGHVSIDTSHRNIPQTTAFESHLHEANTPAKKLTQHQCLQILCRSRRKHKTSKHKTSPNNRHLPPIQLTQRCKSQRSLANPQIYSVNPKINPKIATTLLTPNIIDTGSTAELYTEEPHDATRLSNPNTNAARSLRFRGQNFAFAGSDSDVSSTRY